jgi:hypothetical protein
MLDARMRRGEICMRQFALVVVALFIMLGSTSAQSDEITSIPRINARVAYSKFMKGNIILVDAMGESTYTKYHILGAISLPGDGPADLERIAGSDLQIPFDKEIIVYCD